MGAGTGGTPPPPPGYSDPQLPGVAAGSVNIFRGRLVIVSGPGGAIVGVFVYKAGTVPALGNPPIFWATSSTADPFGNAIPSTAGVAGTGSFRAGNTIITPSGTFTYNGTPGLGNPPQVASVAAGVTQDPFGNALTTVGVLIQAGVISAPGGAPQVQMDGNRNAFFAYDGSANLLFAAAGSAGTDFFGHAYPLGVLIGPNGQLVVSVSASTPAASTAGPVIFGQSDGSLQVRDKLDTELYAVQYRDRAFSSDVAIPSTSALYLSQTELLTGARSYHIDAHFQCAIGAAQTTPKFRLNTRDTAAISSMNLSWWGFQESAGSGASVFSGTPLTALATYNANIGASGWAANSVVDFFVRGTVTVSTAGHLGFEAAQAAASQPWTVKASSLVKWEPI